MGGLRAARRYRSAGVGFERGAVFLQQLDRLRDVVVGEIQDPFDLLSIHILEHLNQTLHPASFVACSGTSCCSTTGRGARTIGVGVVRRRQIDHAATVV